MRANATLNINLPCKEGSRYADSLINITPISCGPYCGFDWLYLMNNLRGQAYVVRMTADGKEISRTQDVPLDEGHILVTELLTEQADRDYNTVTGNGRWSCD